MRAKDKVDALMKQAEFFASRHDERRKYEWKVALGFWAALLAATQIGKISLPCWLAVLIVFVYSFIWSRGLWVANQRDKKVSFRLWDQAQRILADETHKFEPMPDPRDFITRKQLKWWFGLFTDWSACFHILVTAILVFILYTGISLPQETKPQKVEVSGSINLNQE